MSIFYADQWLTVLLGDCREELRMLADESVHCVVTSPPYWGLRDYRLPPLVWGGDDGHEHDWSLTTPRRGDQTASVRWQHTEGGGIGSDGLYRNRHAKSGKNASDAREFTKVDTAFCSCGAWQGSLGLEPMPELWVEHLVDIFHEVWRVLRRDGTIWLNLGDAYAATGNGGGSVFDNGRNDGRKDSEGDKPRGRETNLARVPPGLKPKDLIGLPWRLAFALQADGWYLRSDIIWSKPNPMPESVTDRPTKAHEYLFLLSKGARYFYDADAVREDRTGNTHSRGTKWLSGDMEKVAEAGSGVKNNRSFQAAMADQPNDSGRNLRDVWTIATQPYSAAHFATFPEALVETCIKAGTSENGVCLECGASWTRETKASYDAQGRTTNGPRSKERRHESPGFHVRMIRNLATTGWRAGCDHASAECVPATILDPFAGSGTTALVAERLGRRAILIELSPDYAGQVMERIAAGRRDGTGAPLDLPLPMPSDGLWTAVEA